VDEERTKVCDERIKGHDGMLSLFDIKLRIFKFIHSPDIKKTNINIMP
jgi:hypothetical protein